MAITLLHNQKAGRARSGNVSISSYSVKSTGIYAAQIVANVPEAVKNSATNLWGHFCQEITIQTHRSTTPQIGQPGTQSPPD